MARVRIRDSGASATLDVADISDTRVSLLNYVSSISKGDIALVFDRGDLFLFMPLRAVL